MWCWSISASPRPSRPAKRDHDRDGRYSSEQYRGEATPLADLYALGASLHHALTRRDPRLEPPFSFAERPIRRINSNVSPELEAVIGTALQYNPSDRFPGAQEMKEALLGVARKTGALSKITAALPIQASAVKPLWTFKCEDEIRGSPLLHQGILYVGCYDNNLYSINAADGQFQWKYATDAGVVSRPAVFENNIYIGSEDHRLHVISARSGKLVWAYYTDGKIRSSPRISEGHVFIGSDDQSLHAVNLSTGRASWKFETAEAIRSTPLVANELVYVGSENGDFYAIDFRGDMKWRFQAKRAITSSPTNAGQSIYFASWTVRLRPGRQERMGHLALPPGQGIHLVARSGGKPDLRRGLRRIYLLRRYAHVQGNVAFPYGGPGRRFPGHLQGFALLRLRGRHAVLPGISHRPPALEIRNQGTDHRLTHGVR
jgi:hypothetical protein